MSDNSLYDSFGSNAGYLAELYKLYREDPSLVGVEWADFFRSNPHTANGSVQGRGYSNGSGAEGYDKALDIRAHDTQGVHQASEATTLQAYRLIDAFRRWGHMASQLSPIQAGGILPKRIPELDLSSYLSENVDAGQALYGIHFAGSTCQSLGELYRALDDVYCGSVGYEYDYIVSHPEREWLRDRIEKQGRPWRALSTEIRRDILVTLIKTGLLESELHRKYVGSKWFSVDGSESLIPALQVLLDHCLVSEVREVVFGMAHRGRINVLVNTMGMSLERLFAEFEDRSVATLVGSGDVKYHLGWQSQYVKDGRSVGIELLPNPSHLEFVNAVVEGVSRAKQDTRHERDRRSVLPVVMHGDAAFAGQGIVFECLNYSALEGYSTGGTLHIVINNQIGFTTTPDEGRSTRYCTDLAKGLDIPVFHVNAENPDAVCWITQLALDYRNQFGKDVIIDLIGYRKYGHNEGDDPSFTQPLTYQEIKSKRQIWHGYGEELIAEGIVDQAFVQQHVEQFKKRFAEAQDTQYSVSVGEASALHGRLESKMTVTAVSKERLHAIARELVAFPDSFVPHPKLAKIIQKRVQSVESGKEIEWGVAEALAFGSLVEQGVPVRLSGQDCRRGTFSHRHLVLDDYEKGNSWNPLDEMAQRRKTGGRFEVHNSSLSEVGVVGFEFGYAAYNPQALTLWEAQFGDFSNGAQCIIDQFIVSSEAKWGQVSGVVLLLPHGFEGQGPEHSSARLERYLQLCAEGNISVCYPSNAAQYFHLLRRQGLRHPKRPLIIMTPKSLLRLPAAMSVIEELESGSFAPVIVEAQAKESAKALILMSGKVYYDVAAGLRERGIVDGVICARIEELYPFPEQDIAELLGGNTIQQVMWVQEEPRNQGAWSYVAPRLRAVCGKDPIYVGRPESASTATGSAKFHAQEQRAIIAELVSNLEGA